MTSVLFCFEGQYQHGQGEGPRGALLRRIVREELTRLLETRRPSLLDDWSHEGPDDPNGDAALLADVLALIEREQTGSAARISWEAAKEELARSETLS